MVSTNVVTEAQQSDETATEGMWQLAHEKLARFARSHAGLEWEEGRLLRAAFAVGAHARLGFASFAEYVERLFGYSPRLTREKLRVAEALEGLPELSRALRSGELTWSVVRELTRVTLPTTEGDWLGAARDRTAREVEELVAGHRAGDLPSDAPDSTIRRHFLKFEVSGETRAGSRGAREAAPRDWPGAGRRRCPSVDDTRGVGRTDRRGACELSSGDDYLRTLPPRQSAR